jgi:hypothetical protein
MITQHPRRTYGESALNAVAMARHYENLAAGLRTDAPFTADV